MVYVHQIGNRLYSLNGFGLVHPNFLAVIAEVTAAVGVSNNISVHVGHSVDVDILRIKPLFARVLSVDVLSQLNAGIQEFIPSPGIFDSGGNGHTAGLGIGLVIEEHIGLRNVICSHNLSVIGAVIVVSIQPGSNAAITKHVADVGKHSILAPEQDVFRLHLTHIGHRVRGGHGVQLRQIFAIGNEKIFDRDAGVFLGEQVEHIFKHFLFGTVTPVAEYEFNRFFLFGDRSSQSEKHYEGEKQGYQFLHCGSPPFVL